MRKIVYVVILTASLMVTGSYGSSVHLEFIPDGCCKVCKKGKACGDTCISKDYECHKPRGCACDG